MRLTAIMSHVFFFFDIYFLGIRGLVAVETPLRPLVEAVGDPNPDNLIGPDPSAFLTSDENAAVVGLESNCRLCVV
jgi:hypothetical protein